MKAEAGHKQMKALWPTVSENELPEWVWAITPPSAREKRYGRHPTQKPEALLQRCVRATSRPGQLVLDPFCGHGATGVACVRLGRRFVGIDVDEAYLEVSARRIEAALRQREEVGAEQAQLPLEGAGEPEPVEAGPPERETPTGSARSGFW
jgi:site-specific DNA-methyltransferase (adenine-specific)